MTDSDSPKSSHSGSLTGGAEPLSEIGQDLYCQGCGYNLRGLTGDRCPECGHSLETIRSAKPRIPWVYRKEQGWFRAYWRTVWLVMFRQRLFCEEMARPVSYADAQRFRWVTIMHVYVPFLIATAAYCATATASPRPRALNPETQLWEDLYGMTITNPGSMAIIHVGVLLYLTAVTGVPSYFFHPKGLHVEMQNRAIALSYYSSASLSISALPIAAGLSAYLVGSDSDLGLLLWMVAIAVTLAQLLAWFLDLTRICRRVMPQFERRVLLVGMCVPLLWVAMLGLVLFGIQTIDLYIGVIVELS